jgi:hypothetical protein
MRDASNFQMFKFLIVFEGDYGGHAASLMVDQCIIL